MQLPDLKGVRNASENLQGVSVLTPLVINERLSNDLNCKIYLKREDLQQVRSFKIRGAFNKIRSIDSDYLKNKTLVCASAGNHAQGFAYSCNKLKIYGKIYMPVTTPKQKIERVKIFGGEYVEIILIGDNFDDAQYEAQKQNTDKDLFVHAFDDVNVIEGQGTIGFIFSRNNLTVVLKNVFSSILICSCIHEPCFSHSCCHKLSLQLLQYVFIFVSNCPDGTI